MTATPHLDRLSAALAAGGGGKYLPQTAENMPSSQGAKDLLGEAHEHLRSQCPWYAKVDDGEGAADHATHCQHGTEGGALVKFTPRTAEASTVPQPTVPPGGPGLFHVKGMQLPPYIQHLYKHLVGRYGKQGAYRVAVGVVKRWAQGVNPGGKHPTKTHPDVQAAAAKNVAEWESDKARAHAQSRGSKSDHALAATVVELGSAFPSGQDAPFPGSEQTPLPPVPGQKIPTAMYTAHRVDDTLRHLAHAAERIGEAKRSKSLRSYHMIHVNNHLSRALETCHNLVASVYKNYPAEGRELRALNETIGLAKAVSEDAKAATFAHLLQTILYHLGHAKRHAMCMSEPEPGDLWKFNFDHAQPHMKSAFEHTYKLAHHIYDNYPEEAKWLSELDKAEDPDDPFTGLAGGSLGGGSVVTAPGAMYDVIPPAPGGKYSQYGLHQRPSATISPSPPLPPKVALPTAKEIRALIPEVPRCEDVTLSNTVKTFLETAAVKMEREHVLDSLTMLRAAQAAIIPAHKKDIGLAMPAVYTANVFARVPPAARSSATTAMLQSRERTQEWRMLERHVQALADRIRKRFFHGVFSGPNQMARLT